MDDQTIYNLQLTTQKTIAENHLEVCERLKKVETRLESVPSPLAQPCGFLTAHEDKHKENLTLWKRGIVAGIITILFSIGLNAWTFLKIIVRENIK